MIAEYQVGTDGYPDLSEDGVFGCAQEGFDLKVLLDPAEEDLNVPTGFTRVQNRFFGQLNEGRKTFCSFNNIIGSLVKWAFGCVFLSAPVLDSQIRLK